MKLFDRRLLVVHGKGGVGRTTITATLGLAASLRGKRVCVVELGAQAALARTFGMTEPSYEARTVAPGLDLRSMSPTACMSDFGSRKLRIDALARWFFESRLMVGFVEAVPGLHDVVQLGKIENMLSEPLPGEPVYDLVVLDAPATGHGLTLLGAAKALGDMTRVGPFYDLAHIIETFLADPTRTGHVLTALPEPLPAQEALELEARLRAQDGRVDALVLNRVQRPPLPDTAASRALEAALVGHPLASLVDHAHQRLGRQEQALDILRTGHIRNVPMLRVPSTHPAPHSVEALRPLADAVLEALP